MLAVLIFPGVQNNPLDIASVFHIFAEKADLNTHTNGNLAVQNLVDQVNFGTNVHEWLVKQDVSYIQQVTSIAASSFVADQLIETRSVAGIFLAFPLKAGANHVRLTFILPGFELGVVLTIAILCR